MITLESLRESSFYQFVLDEGHEQGRQEGARAERQRMLVSVAELVRYLADKNFPGIQIDAELAVIHNPDSLNLVCRELDEMADADGLRRRLLELAEPLS